MLINFGFLKFFINILGNYFLRYNFDMEFVMLLLMMIFFKKIDDIIIKDIKFS